MKAGIYKRRDNGKHIYVAKDRSIRAHQLTDCHPSSGSVKVTTSEKEQVVSWFSRDADARFVADRVADVPNGVTQHDQALAQYVAGLGAPEFFDGSDADGFPGGDERFVGMPPTLEAPYGDAQIVGDAVVGALRNVGIGVPRHVADKIVEDYRRAYPAMADAASIDGIDGIDDGTKAPVMSVKRFFDSEGLADIGIDSTALASKMFFGVEQVNAFAREDRYTQLMLAAQELGLVEHDKHDMFFIRDVEKFNEFCDSPPTILPVVPKGWYAKHARPQRVSAASLTAEQTTYATIEEAQAAAQRYHTGGLVSAERMQEIDAEVAARISAPSCEPLYRRECPHIPMTPSRGSGAPMIPSRVSNEEWWSQKVRQGVVRLIGRQSKRKHRKAGHRVFWCAPLNSWAWEPQA